MLYAPRSNQNNMGYYNYYASKVIKLRKLLSGLDIKIVDKDNTYIFLSVEGLTFGIERVKFRELIKKLKL